MKDAPIFIHSLFRAGSTYLFHVFRRSEHGYWCYQEALHEFVFLNRDIPDNLLSIGKEKIEFYRHPPLDDAYWHELYRIWPAWKDAITEPIIYDAYFLSEGEDIGVSYWRALAEAARGRPVFQECRTSGRIAAIKREMGGYHIYLWRNPWDQWWSYKVTPYFDIANQLIIHARQKPKPVQLLLEAIDLPSYDGKDLAGAFAFYGERPLSSEQSYLVFYLLWCLALREGIRHADLLLNIDRLSDSPEYRSEILARLKEAHIEDLDFSDCRVPQGYYLEQEQAFFLALEERAHQWLLDGGWRRSDIDEIQLIRHQNEPRSWSTPVAELPPADLVEQAYRARELAKRYETTQAERARNTTWKLNKAETRAQQAEARIAQAQAREAEAKSQMQQALDLARQAQKLASQAETRAQQAEARIAQAQAREAEAKSQMQQALEQAQQAQEKARKAEARAQQAEARIAQAQAREAEAKSQMQQALEQAQQAQEKARKAEARAQQAEARAAQAQAREAEAKSQMQQAIQRALHAEERVEEVLKLYSDIINSKSWRITKPLRYGGMFANRLIAATYHWLTFSPTSIPKRVLKQTLTKTKHYINARPRFKTHVINMLEHFPKLSDKLQRLEYSAFPSTSLHTLEFSLKDSIDSSGDLELSCLSLRAQQIYMDLKKATERTKCPK